MNKRGSSFLSDNLLGIIVGAAVLIILVILLLQLTQPFYDKENEVARSYFTSLKQTLKNAKESGSDQLIISQDLAPSRYFLIYFEDSSYQTINSFDTYSFFLKGTAENTLCICPVLEEDVNTITCNKKYCTNLKKPLLSIEKTAIPLEAGTTIDFSYSEKYYSISLINEGDLEAGKYKESLLRITECAKFYDDDEIITDSSENPLNQWAKERLKETANPCLKTGSLFFDKRFMVLQESYFECDGDFFSLKFDTIKAKSFWAALSGTSKGLGLIIEDDEDSKVLYNIRNKDEIIGSINMINGNIEIKDEIDKQSRYLLTLENDDLDYTLKDLEFYSHVATFTYVIDAKKNNVKPSYSYDGGKWTNELFNDKNYDIKDGIRELKNSETNLKIIYN